MRSTERPRARILLKILRDIDLGRDELRKLL